jgi:hypothetical protein
MKLPDLPLAFIASLKLPTKAVTKRAIAASLVILFLGIVTSFGYLFYQKRQAVAYVRPALKLSSNHVSDLLERGEPPSGMPDESYFKKNESSIAEIEKRVAEIRSLAKAGHKTIYYNTVKHMQLSETAIQEISALYQHISRIDAGKEMAKDAKASLKKARGIHDAGYRRKTLMELLNENEEELEATRQSRRKIVSILMQIRLTQAALEKAVDAQYLVDDAILTKAIIRFSIENPPSGVSSR